MRAKSAVVVAGVWLLLAALPVRAHHAFSAEFDIGKPLKMQGTLTKWEMINPHSWFHINVKGADGAVVPWLVCALMIARRHHERRGRPRHQHDVEHLHRLG